jgi:uncharacterized coiled-coil protein SlyX
LKKRAAIGRIAFAVKIATMAVCFFFALGGHYPPCLAQRVQQIPVLTVEDAVQDTYIKSINDHLVGTDARAEAERIRLEDLKKELNDLKSDVSGMHAEARVVQFIIGALSSAGLILQVRRKPAA